jgi:xylulokinase
VLWDPSLLGTIDGLTLRTTTAEIALGFVAGIVVESKRCVAALGGGHSIVISGSGATPFFVRCLADATGIPVRSDASEHDHSALGAALLAGRSVLGFEDTAEATGIVTQPDPSAFAAWESRFAEHERLRAAVPIRRR